MVQSDTRKVVQIRSTNISYTSTEGVSCPKIKFVSTLALLLICEMFCSQLKLGSNTINSKFLPLLPFILLRSESPSGMCAKLRTVAASNNRVHLTRSLYYCLFAPHIYGVVHHAHSVGGEPRISAQHQ